MDAHETPKIFISHSTGDRTNLPSPCEYFGTFLEHHLKERKASLTVYRPHEAGFPDFSNIQEEIRSSDGCICVVGQTYISEESPSFGLTNIALREMCYAFNHLGSARVLIIDIEHALEDALEDALRFDPVHRACFPCNPTDCSRTRMLAAIGTHCGQGHFFVSVDKMEFGALANNSQGGGKCLDAFERFVKRISLKNYSDDLKNLFLPVPKSSQRNTQLASNIVSSLSRDRNPPVGELSILCGSPASGKTAFARSTLTQALENDGFNPVFIDLSLNLAETIGNHFKIPHNEANDRIKQGGILPLLLRLKENKSVFILDEGGSNFLPSIFKSVIDNLLYCKLTVISIIRPRTLSLCCDSGQSHKVTAPAIFHLPEATDHEAASLVGRICTTYDRGQEACDIAAAFDGETTKYNLLSMMFAAFCSRKYTSKHIFTTFGKEDLRKGIINTVFDDQIEGKKEKCIKNLFLKLSVIYADPHIGIYTRLIKRNISEFSGPELDLLNQFISAHFLSIHEKAGNIFVFIPSDAVISLTRICQWLESDLGDKAFYLTLLELLKRISLGEKGGLSDWPQSKVKEWCYHRGLLLENGEPRQGNERDKALADAVEWAARYAGEVRTQGGDDPFSPKQAGEYLKTILELTAVKEMIESAAHELDGIEVHASLRKLAEHLRPHWQYATSGLLRKALVSLQGVESIVTVTKESTNDEKGNVNVVQWIGDDRLVYGTYGGQVGTIDLSEKAPAPKSVTDGTRSIYYIATSPCTPSQYVSVDWSGNATCFKDNTTRILVNGQGRLFCAAYSSDGRHIVVAGGKGEAWLTTPEGDYVSLKGHREDTVVFGACFADEGRSVVTVSYAGDILVHDRQDGRLTDRISLDPVSSFNHVATPPDRANYNKHAIVVSCVDGSAYLYQLKNGRLEQKARLSGHSHWVRCAEFSPDGAMVVTASSDTRAYLWDVKSLGRPRLCAVLSGHTSWLRQAIFSPQGDMIATASRDGQIGLWDTTGRSLAMLRGHREWVRHIAFSPARTGDVVRLASSGKDGTVRVWRPYDYRPTWPASIRTASTRPLAVATPEPTGPAQPVTKVVVMGEETVAVLQRAKDASGWLYQRTAPQPWTPTALPEGIIDLEVDSDGIHVISAAAGNCYNVVANMTGRPVHIVAAQAHCLSRSPDGTVHVIGTLATRPCNGKGPTLTIEGETDSWEIRYAAFAAQSFAVHLTKRKQGVIASDIITSMRHGPDCDQQVRLTPHSTGVTARCMCGEHSLKFIRGTQNQDLHSYMKLKGVQVNATTGTEVNTIKRINISPCGEYFVSAILDNEARLYFTSEDKSIKLLAQDTGMVAHAELVDLQEKGEIGILTTGGDGSVRMWSTVLEKSAHPTLLGVRYGHLAPATYVAIIEDSRGRQFVSGGADGSVCFWNTSVFDGRDRIIEEIERHYHG